jgi:hypothetical protein
MPLGSNRQQQPSRATASFDWRRLPRAVARWIFLLFRPAIRPLAWRMRTFLSFEILKAIADQKNFLVLQQHRILDAIGDLLDGNNQPTDGKLPRYPIGAKPAIRIVHQFHSGSARGDAITNSMILIQRILRELGFESEIFVEHHPGRASPRQFGHAT